MSEYDKYYQPLSLEDSLLQIDTSLWGCEKVTLYAVSRFATIAAEIQSNPDGTYEDVEGNKLDSYLAETALSAGDAQTWIDSRASFDMVKDTRTPEELDTEQQERFTYFRDNRSQKHQPAEFSDYQEYARSRVILADELSAQVEAQSEPEIEQQPTEQAATKPTPASKEAATTPEPAKPQAAATAEVSAPAPQTHQSQRSAKKAAAKAQAVSHKRDDVADLLELDKSGRAHYKHAIQVQRDATGKTILGADGKVEAKKIGGRFMSKHELDLIEEHQDQIRSGLAHRAISTADSVATGSPKSTGNTAPSDDSNKVDKAVDPSGKYDEDQIMAFQEFVIANTNKKRAEVAGLSFAKLMEAVDEIDTKKPAVTPPVVTALTAPADPAARTMVSASDDKRRFDKPQSRLSRTKEFVRRHKFAISGLGALAVAGVGITIALLNRNPDAVHHAIGNLPPIGSGSSQDTMNQAASSAANKAAKSASAKDTIDKLASKSSSASSAIGKLAAGASDHSAKASGNAARTINDLVTGAHTPKGGTSAANTIADLASHASEAPQPLHFNLTAAHSWESMLQAGVPKNVVLEKLHAAAEQATRAHDIASYSWHVDAVNGTDTWVELVMKDGSKVSDTHSVMTELGRYITR